MSNEEIFTLVLMRNGGLFLQIREGVQASQRLKKTDEYKSRKQNYSGANKEQNTENLTSTSPGNNVRWREQRAKIRKV